MSAFYSARRHLLELLSHGASPTGKRASTPVGRITPLWPSIISHHSVLLPDCYLALLRGQL